MTDSFNLAEELESLDPELTSNTLPEPGTYLFEVVSGEFRVSKNGVPNINMRVQFADGRYKGRSEFLTIYYSKKSPESISMFWRQLKAVGVTNEWITEKKATLADAALQTVGARFNGSLKIREFRGNDEVSIFPNKFVEFNEDARSGLDETAADTSVAALPDLDDEEPAAQEQERVPLTKDPVVEQERPKATVGAAEDDPWG